MPTLDAGFLFVVRLDRVDAARRQRRKHVLVVDILHVLEMGAADWYMSYIQNRKNGAKKHALDVVDAYTNRNDTRKHALDVVETRERSEWFDAS